MDGHVVLANVSDLSTFKVLRMIPVRLAVPVLLCTFLARWEDHVLISRRLVLHSKFAAMGRRTDPRFLLWLKSYSFRQLLICDLFVSGVETALRWS